LNPASGRVILGDGSTTLDIKGVGTVRCMIGPNMLRIPNVRYVPGLAESIYSLFLHIKQKDHGLQSSFDTGLLLKFPTFQTPTIVGSDDIYIDALPHVDNRIEENTLPEPELVTSDSVCRHVTQLDGSSTLQTKSDTNILKCLQEYYSDVKTKCQLNLDVPAGFRQHNNLQWNFNKFLPPGKLRSAAEPSEKSISSESTEMHTLNIQDDLPTPVTNDSSGSQVPILRCVDKISTSLPARLTFSEDYIRASVGFRRIDTIKGHIKELYQDTISLDSTPEDAVLDKGVFATMRKCARSTVPVLRPNKFGDVIHMDIVFGPDISIGNIHYGLLFLDRYSRMTYIYPLQNLTSDIKKQSEAFFCSFRFCTKKNHYRLFI
jgi:hypothetical protein